VIPAASTRRLIALIRRTRRIGRLLQIGAGGIMMITIGVEVTG